MIEFPEVEQEGRTITRISGCYPTFGCVGRAAFGASDRSGVATRKDFRQRASLGIASGWRPPSTPRPTGTSVPGEYPLVLYERLVAVTQMRPPSRLLKIGCATGKATLHLAQRGFRITALEPGPAVAAAARANLADCDVEGVEDSVRGHVMPDDGLILVCGLPRAGKTTLAVRLARDLRAIRLCPDVG